jgi:chorismate mutase
LEDTIIFSLIERAQFAHNPIMYEKGAFDELQQIGFEGTWLEWFLKEIETFHARARRYTSPDEYPFTSDLPTPMLPPLSMPQLLYTNNVDMNTEILSQYVTSIVPRITKQVAYQIATPLVTPSVKLPPNSPVLASNGLNGHRAHNDDGNYGSAATLDVEVLQAISKRIHYGKFVSESKFLACPSAFVPHILNPNPKKLEELITKPDVERALLERLGKKAYIYGRGLAASNDSGTEADVKIEAEDVKEIYREVIIPLTKKVEVEYLLQRLNGLSEQEIKDLQEQPCTPQVTSDSSGGDSPTYWSGSGW